MASLLAGSQGRPFAALCLGLNATDHLCRVPGFPQPGRKLRMSELATSGGGQSATAACALARLGHRVAYAGVCGDDEPGRQVAPLLERFGVEPVGLVVKPGTRSQQALILVEEQTAERTIIWFRDQDCHLDPADLSPDLIAQCRVLHIDGHFVEASLQAARWAREAGVLVSLDGERVFSQTRELVSLCDVVVGSEDFPQRLTGLSDPQAACAALAEMGPAWVGRTLGPNGAELLVDGQRLRQPAFPVPAIDTTGAGDVFHAGLVHAILLGQPPAPALVTACALAAISVTALGGRGAMATRGELEEFMRTGGETLFGRVPRLP